MQNAQTTREVVLEMTANGRAPREIAFVLDMSVQNIYLHLRNAGVKPAPRLHPRRGTR